MEKKWVIAIIIACLIAGGIIGAIIGNATAGLGAAGVLGAGGLVARSQSSAERSKRAIGRLRKASDNVAARSGGIAKFRDRNIELRERSQAAEQRIDRILERVGESKNNMDDN